jgi:PEP-CTERM motif
MKTQTIHCYTQFLALFMRLIPSSRRTNCAAEISNSATDDRQMSAFMIGKIGASILLVLAFAGSGPNAFAAPTHTAQESFDNQITALQNTASLKWDPKQEAASVVAESILEAIDAWKNGLFSVGQININGSNPFIFATGSSTLTADLTFEWMNPMTGLPTTGPAISTVDYYLWTGTGNSLDPSSSTWSLVGTSSNAASDFEFTYSFASSENIFYGVPLSSGFQIVITGAGGYNDAQDTVPDIVATPEPASLFLLGSGVLGLGGLLRKRLLT